MPESWIATPLIVTVTLSVIGALIAIGVWIGGVNRDRTHLKESTETDRSLFQDFMKEIRDDIKKILLALPSPTATGKSPMQLTEFGENIAKRIGVLDWAASEAETVLDPDALIELQPFQIEAFYQNYIEEESSKEGIIRDNVNRAIYEFGINRDQALPVLRIPLREALLKRQETLQRSTSS